MQKTLNAIDKKKTANSLLMIVTVLLFAWHYVQIFAVPYRNVIEGYFPMLWAGLAVIFVQRSFAYKQKGTWILLAGVGLIFARSLVAGRQHDSYVLKVLTNAVWAFGVCYHIGFGFDQKDTLKFLRMLAAVWTVLQAVMGIVGIFCALFDYQIINFNGSESIGLEYGRLSLMAVSTRTASTAVISLLLAMVGLAITRSRIGRLGNLAALIIFFCVVSITSTRTAFLTLGIGLGVYAGFTLWNWLCAKKKWKTFRASLCSLVCMVMVIVLTCAALIGFGYVFNAAKDAMRAQAEMVAAPGMDVAHRGFEIRERMFSGREDIWEAVLMLLRDKPKYLLAGASMGKHVMLMVNEYFGTKYDHIHCMYLQVLVELGIPGLLVLGTFIAMFARSAWRVLTDRNKPVWVRLLPLLPIVVLTAELAECITLLEYNKPALYFMMLFVGLTVRAAKDETIR